MKFITFVSGEHKNTVKFRSTLNIPTIRARTIGLNRQFFVYYKLRRADTEGGTQAEGVGEQGVEDNIWA